MSRAAQNTANYEARMKAKGFVRKHVWVPADKAGEVEALAEKYRFEERRAQDPEVERVAILQNLRAHQEELNALGIAHLKLFGSVARLCQQSDSDVDLMYVLFAGKRVSLFELAAIERVLRKYTGRNVDLVQADRLKEHVRPNALVDAIEVF